MLTDTATRPGAVVPDCPPLPDAVDKNDLSAVIAAARAVDRAPAVEVAPTADAPSAVTAMVAAARAKLALAGPDGWEGRLETRNMLVDFINAAALATAGGDVSHLKPAEDLADEIEASINTSSGPRSARTRLALTPRLNEEGFEVSGFVRPLLDEVGVAPPVEHRAPRWDDADAAGRWEVVQDAFLVAEQESERASDIESEHHDDNDGSLEELHARHKPIHQAWRIARDTLYATPAPHWAALSMKAGVIIRFMEPARWTKAVLDFCEVADEIGKTRPAEADLISVMKARGHAEQIAYYAANRPDGYADWACGLHQISQMAVQIESLVDESRDLARCDPRHAAMSAAVIDAVWFNRVVGHDRLSHVEELDEEFSEVIRTYHTLDEKRVQQKNLTADEEAQLQKADARLDEIQDTVFAEPPLTRSGVAFQLLVASSLIDRVYGGATDEMRAQSGEHIRTAIANAIRVMGLPFDYRAAQYFMGPQLNDLDGRDRGGPKK